LVLDGVWLLTGGLLVLVDDGLDDEFTSLCGIVELWLEVVSGGVVLLDELLGGVVLLLLLLVELPLGEVAVLLELVGGWLVLGEVLLLGDVLELLLGLFTSLCGIVPVLLPLALQSDEIIFTLLTVRVFELEDDGLVLPLAVPVALPLPEVDPVTWTIWPTCGERLEVSPCRDHVVPLVLSVRVKLPDDPLRQPWTVWLPLLLVDVWELVLEV
jgi:hypothetical protein